MFEDLLEQARVLAKLDTRGKPRQANLRRAVSSLYYALFHFLVERACRAIIGARIYNAGIGMLWPGAFLTAQ
jgi:hypothetical protein